MALARFRLDGLINEKARAALTKSAEGFCERT